MMPTHVGIIVDGNGRWATKRGLSRSDGHKAGSKRLDSLCEYVLDKGIKVLSLYVFSTENFKRSDEEVNYLMDLFIKKFQKDFKHFEKKGVRITFSGRKEPLKKEILTIMDDLMNKTKDNLNGTLNFCLNYGSHAEIIDACKKIAFDYKENNIDLEKLNEETFSKYLYHDLPPLDLVIRTGGELRLSNFMMWQASYSEFYFTDTLFPDFDNEAFDQAVASFENRNRRYGGIEYEKENR